ncbi:hypothetical protein MLD38_014199 [Melastoma candidum]|uniref:Uncharacterized protein n=1 Tax=Melastoma candidum TaxID=119954 RepID=A0ACB9RBM8_9MYRT|nr:hypothetical protein MLD38_014199 [Melastoma candidum]
MTSSRDGLLLPLPPAVQGWHSPSCSFSNFNHLPRSSSVNKLKSSLSSTTFLRSMSMRKGGNKNDDEKEGVGRNNGLNRWSKLKKKQDKLKLEDSIWTKTIILGEKCRVPDDDEGVYYDNKGNKISHSGLGPRDRWPSLGPDRSPIHLPRLPDSYRRLIIVI